MNEQVILVNERDEVIGAGEKMQTHRLGRLHRAFSVFVFSYGGSLLLQRRAAVKYHSGGLWSNTCCGHPRPGEETLAAAHRRLQEEMGFDCGLEFAFSFKYRAALEGGIIEHEIDHVFIGQHEQAPSPDAGEVEAWRWAPLAPLLEDMRSRPQRYTSWLHLSLAELARHRIPRSVFDAGAIPTAPPT